MRRATDLRRSECGIVSKYFDRIPHQDLMRSVARRIVDRHVLQLIKL